MNLSKCRRCFQAILMPVLAASLCAGLGSGCKTGFLARRRQAQPELLGPRTVLPPPYTMPAPESAAPVSDLPTIELPDDLLIAPLVFPTDEDLPPALEFEPTEPDTIRLPPTVDSELLTYAVKKGDTLWEIAKAYGITYQELADFNDMDVKAKLIVGTVLRVPPGGHYVPPENRSDVVPTTRAEEPTPTKPAPASSGSARASLPTDGKYTVQSGDSLWVISRRFGVPIDTVRRLNQLQNDVLQIGQVLVLKEAGVAAPTPTPTPAPEPPGTTEPSSAGATAPNPAPPTVETPAFPKRIDHQVCEGDTLDIIAEMYDSNVEAIKTLNPDIAGNENLTVGTIISVPYHD